MDNIMTVRLHEVGKVSVSVKDAVVVEKDVPGVGVPPGGASGQVLTKLSGADYDTGWRAAIGGGENDHGKLTNRDAQDQHPIGAIAGLAEALEGKQPKGDYLTADKLQSATDAALAQAKASGAFDGAPGTPGAKGDKGDTGAKGDPGEKGDKGDTGATGPAGPQGPAGVPGKDGANGKDGADGKPGAAGADGITPTIGDNGNWYIGSTDTGKPSRGVAGAKGADGANGKDGARGENGADGKTPVRGTDYWTAADKQEIVNDVLAAIPDGTEVAY